MTHQQQELATPKGFSNGLTYEHHMYRVQSFYAIMKNQDSCGRCFCASHQQFDWVIVTTYNNSAVAIQVENNPYGTPEFEAKTPSDDSTVNSLCSLQH